MAWNPDKYAVGWICAINAEGVAARLFLDEAHDPPPSRSETDGNTYSLGRIGKHNVVIASLPDGEYGLVSAAIVARDMLHAFPKVRIGLLVGVAGGAPSDQHDVRLGDVVINSGETLHYDYGKEIQDQPFLMTGHLNRPPIVLRTAVSALRNDYTLIAAQGRNPIEEAVEQVLQRYPELLKTYSRPDNTTDRLFRSDFLHGDFGLTCDQARCSSNAYNLARRKERRDANNRTKIHYGKIASANRLMKDATIRDRIAKNDGVLCFEMEAAGLMNLFPCLVIRGICDYSDTHKNNEWQGFASLVAAACARDLLGKIAPTAVEDEKPISKAMTAQTRLMEVKEWLNPADPSTNSNDARKVRYRDTGEWLLKSRPFREWEDGGRRQLWLHGMQGCGKTVLVYTIMERVAAKTGGDGAIVRFFFDCRDPKKQSFDSMVRGLIYQLYCSGEEAEFNAIYSSLDGKMKEGQPPTDFLVNSLYAALKARRNVSIVLDALDECNTRPELLKWLTALVKDARLEHVKLVATSRPEGEFGQTMRGLIGDEGCVALSSEDIKADIRSYVQGSLEQRTGFEKWSEDPGVLHRIAKVVIGKADGMFRFAACLLDRLEHCPDVQSLEDVLKSVPRDLADIYEKILDQLPREGDLRDRIIRLLQFLVYPNQQLSLDEAVDIVAVQQRGFKKALQSICTGPDGKTLKILKVAHSSVRDYLLERHPEIFAEQESYKVIALTCLEYLTSIEEAAGPQDVKRDYHLADYAAQYWMEYARLSEASDEVVDAATEFFSDRRRLKLWTGLYDKPKAEVRGTALYYACQNNLPRLSQRLIQAMPEKLDRHAEGEYGYGYPLQAAAREGHLEIVRLLLDSKANVNNVDGAYGTALQAACRWHQKDVVELLLSHKADSNIHAGCDWNALHAAITGPRTPVLVPGGDQTAVAAVATPAEDDEEPLMADVEIVKLLLENGAKPNAGGRYGSALGVALHKNRADLADLLLDHGADVDLTMMFNRHTDADGTVTCEEYTPLFLAGYPAPAQSQNFQSPQATNLGQSCTPAQTHQTHQAQRAAQNASQTEDSSSSSHNYQQGFQNQSYQPQVQPENLHLQQAENPVQSFQPPQKSNPTPAYQMQRTQSQPNSYKYQQQAAAQAPQAQQGATQTGYYPAAQFQQHAASQGVAASAQTLQIPQTAHHRVQMNHTGPSSAASHSASGGYDATNNLVCQNGGTQGREDSSHGQTGQMNAGTSSWLNGGWQQQQQTQQQQQQQLSPQLQQLNQQQTQQQVNPQVQLQQQFWHLQGQLQQLHQEQQKLLQQHQLNLQQQQRLTSQLQQQQQGPQLQLQLQQLQMWQAQLQQQQQKLRQQQQLKQQQQQQVRLGYLQLQQRQQQAAGQSQWTAQTQQVQPQATSASQTPSQANPYRAASATYQLSNTSYQAAQAATHQGQGYNLQQGQQQYHPFQGSTQHPQPQQMTGATHPSQTPSHAAPYGAYPSSSAAYQTTTNMYPGASTAQQGQGYHLQPGQQQQHNTLSPYVTSQANSTSQLQQLSPSQFSNNTQIDPSAAYPYTQAGQSTQAQVTNSNPVQPTTPQAYSQTQQQYQTPPVVNGQAVPMAYQYPNAQTQYSASQAALTNNQTYQATSQQLPSNQAASNGFQPQNPQASQWQQPGYQHQSTWNVNNAGWQQQQ
ncbi:ankyrin repeat protein [Colletotrichum plurivorum]|uniref:Ankyrin repeat protein n=1 Tax=Colletotrichum plurivorum TaxID=2175906 RepID=A0A8H6KBK8_9PEZI|nr:ankyrin repeat protein [Colletotrichum plurivorum]